MNKKYIIITGIIIILAIAGIFATRTINRNAIKEPEIKEFTVKAFRFGYAPDTINVNKGDKVKITIDNSDVTHGIRIPDYNLRNNEIIEFTANKTGEFDWYCANMCGKEHMQMKGKLIVK